MKESQGRIDAWLQSTTAVVTRRPIRVLALGIIIAFAAVGFTIQNLEFQTRRQDLINPSSDFQQRWLAYTDEFGEGHDVVIVVAAASPSQVRQAVDDLGTALRQHPELYTDVLDRFRAETLIGKGLFYLPLDKLASLEAQVLRVVEGFKQRPSELERFLKSAQRPASALPPTWGVDLENSIRDRFPNYVTSNQNRVGIIALRLITRTQSFVPDDEPIVELKSILAAAGATHPNVEFGLTGIPILEYAEMKTSEDDMRRASILSLVSVAILFWAGFGTLRYPMAGVAVLLMGLAWTFGYVSVTVGHLNILSVSFGVILIGLGIDFSLHYIARYCELRRKQPNVATALGKTAGSKGTAILTGAVTTAAAFMSTGWTEFRGVAELGWIAGGGILLCLVATICMLPALLMCIDRRDFTDGVRMLELDQLFAPIWRQRWQVIATGSVLTLFLASGLTRITYDHNLLNLQAENLPSVQWEKRLLTETDRSTWFAISIAEDPQEIARRKAEFLSLDTVERVEEVSNLTEIDNVAQRVHHIQSIRNAVETALSQPPDDTDAHRTHQLEQLQAIQRVANPSPPSVSDLPKEICTRFIGQTGKQMLRVFARGNVWQMEQLDKFMKQIQSVDAFVTGEPVQAYYGSRQMRSSYLRAATGSAVAVLLILLWDLRDPRRVLLAALPTTLGIIQLFGLMGLLEIPLNPANIIVLPLIIGIGIDDGVHVVHDLRQGQLERTGLSQATVTGIVLTSLTSMIGFGSLMLANHEGLKSLGRIATLGIACCLVTSTVLLPCIVGGRTTGARFPS